MTPHWVLTSTSFIFASDSHNERTRRANLEVCISVNSVFLSSQIMLIIPRFYGVCNIFSFQTRANQLLRFRNIETQQLNVSA